MSHIDQSASQSIIVARMPMNQTAQALELLARGQMMRGLNVGGKPTMKLKVGVRLKFRTKPTYNIVTFGLIES
jgi:hypothetical protein